MQVRESFHKNCVQRKIRRAVRENFTYEEGTGEPLLATFYHLLVQTRRRQCLPPQPRTWFRNLIACMNEKLTIRVVSASGRPAAAILTLKHKDTTVYKYACSDPELHHLGGVQFLIWSAIEQAVEEGCRWFDFGRSDWDNPGLITFKDRWGAQRSMVTSWRSGEFVQPGSSGWEFRLARNTFGRIPARLLPMVGNLIYKHLHRP